MSYGQLAPLWFAQAQDAGADGSGGMWMLLIQVGLILVIFYFLLIRPQQKRAKEHQNMLNALKVGDEVITNGGLLGRIAGVTDNYLTVEIAPNVKVRVVRGQVAGLKAPDKSEEKSAK